MKAYVYNLWYWKIFVNKRAFTCNFTKIIGPPFYGVLIKILETFNNVFNLLQLSKTVNVNITAISVCVFYLVDPCKNR